MRRQLCKITASTNVLKSAVSFDFVVDGGAEFDFEGLRAALYEALEKADVKPTGIDFRSVDYSSYPEFATSNVCQGGIDFEWVDSGLPDEAGYIEDDIESYLAQALLDEFGYELIGVDFYSLED